MNNPMSNYPINNDKIQLSLEGEELNPRAVTKEISSIFTSTGTTFRNVSIGLGAVFLIGIVSFVLRALDGFDDS